MGAKTTLALLLLVGGLFAVLMFTREKPPEQGNVSVALLAGKRLGQATRLQWQFATMAPVELRRQPGGPFRITLPVDDLASVSYLTNIANTYDSAMIGETPLPDTEENRERTGLKEPQLVIDIEFEDGTSQHLELGAEGPLGTDVFLRRDGKIYRGGLALLTSMQVGIDDLRERNVWKTTAQIAREVIVDHALSGGVREHLRLVRHEEGWQLQEPFVARADGGAAESFVRNVLSLRIDLFPDGVIRLPEGPADISVTVRGGPMEEHLDLWRDGQDNLFGRLADRKIFFKSINNQYIQIFKNGADDLRSRVLFPLRDFYHEIVTIAVDPGDGARIVVHRDTPDQRWALQEPVVAAIDATAVNELLTAVNNLQALTFLPPGSGPEQYGISTSGLSVAIQGALDPRPTVVRIGNDGVEAGLEITYVARADGLTEIVTVPRGPIGVLRRPWTDLVVRRVFAIEEAVTRLDLGKGDNRRARRLFVGDDGRWADRDGAAVDDAEIADYVDRLRDLRAKGVRIARKEGLGSADWTLVMARRSDPDDGVGFGALEVWDRDGQPLLVRSQTGDRDVLYELSPTDSRNLRGLWR